MPHLTTGGLISFAPIGIMGWPLAPRRRVSALTSGLPRERSGSSGFIGFPTIQTTQTEISYKLNENL
jgi:hypothetical protein